ncbi:MAG: oligosaccharide flippase family protein [Gemmataceae bacterium]|nr:oligosaccharide flippase family protein [Gemmataceae bacterium]
MSNRSKPSLLRHAAVYSVGELLILAGGFVLLPLYARCLSVSDFGNLELLEQTADIFALCMMLRSLPLAVMAFHRQAVDDAERQRVLGAALILAGAALLIGIAMTTLTSGPLGVLLRQDQPSLLVAAVAAALLDAVATVVLATWQARMESLHFVAVSLGQFVVKIALALLFVLGFGWGVWGVLLAFLIRAGLFAAVMIGREWRLGLRLPDGKTLRDMLRFVLPLLPVGLCFFVLHSGDRYFLIRSTGAEDVGFYGLGTKLARLVGLFTLTPLYRAWSVRMYDVAGQADAPEVIGRATTRMLACYVFVGLGLCLFCDEVIALFAGPAFAPASVVVAPIVLAYWFYGASVLLDGPFYVRRRTSAKLWLTLASTAFMLGLYACLIPLHGALGAAWATLGGFAFHAGLTLIVGQRVFRVRYEFGRLAVLLGLSIGLWSMAKLIPDGSLAIPARIGLYMLWPALLWICCIVSPEEKLWLRSVARKVTLPWPRASLKPSPSLRECA